MRVSLGNTRRRVPAGTTPESPLLNKIPVDRFEGCPMHWQKSAMPLRVFKA